MQHVVCCLCSSYLEVIDDNMTVTSAHTKHRGPGGRPLEREEVARARLDGEKRAGLEGGWEERRKGSKVKKLLTMFSPPPLPPHIE